MASRDLRIRLLGRPQITEDSALGYRKITRRYVVEGIKASRAGLAGTLDSMALFRKIGEEDEEFKSYYLVNQRIEPSKSVDKAYLVREYAHVRDSYNSESITESTNVKRISRRYVVLRCESVDALPVPGYAADQWKKHPTNVTRSTDTLTPNRGQMVTIYKSDDDDPYIGKWPSGVIAIDGAVQPVLTMVRGKSYKFKLDYEATDFGNTETTASGRARRFFFGTLPDAGEPVDLESEPPYLGDIEGCANCATVTRHKASDGDVDILIKEDCPDTIYYHDAMHKGAGGKIEIVDAPAEPQNTSGEMQDSYDPWDYLPMTIRNTEPTSVEYYDGTPFSGAASTPAGTTVYEPGSSSANMSSTLSGRVSLSWVRASAQVDYSNPGVDVWNVSWAAPVLPYWAKMSRKGAMGQSRPSILDFDENGIKFLKGAASNASTTAYSYTFFTVGAFPDSAISGWVSDGEEPSVSMDFHMVGKDGNQRTQSFRQTFSNTMFQQDTTSGLKFTASDGGNDIEVAVENPYELLFNYEAAIGATTYPLYQGRPIILTGGHISWTHTYDPSVAYASFVGGSITPVFSHNDTRIWKITLNYV